MLCAAGEPRDEGTEGCCLWFALEQHFTSQPAKAVAVMLDTAHCMQASVSDIAQRAAAASAAALLSISSLAGSALASEFDILAEPTPTKNYFVHDASVLSKATRSYLK